MGSGNLLVLLTIGSTECAERTFFIRISIHLVLVNATPPRYTPRPRGDAPSQRRRLGDFTKLHIIFPPILFAKNVSALQKNEFLLPRDPPPRARPALQCFSSLPGSLEYDKQQIAPVIKSKRLNRLLRSVPHIQYKCTSMNANEKKKVSYPWKPTNAQRIRLISIN